MTKRILSIPLILVVLLISGPVSADIADLKRTIADLTVQADDKDRLDELGVAKIELAEIRRWLKDATDAVKQEEEDEARRVFDRVRAQLQLVDQLIALSTAKAKSDALSKKLTEAKAAIKKARTELEQKSATLRAFKIKK